MGFWKGTGLSGSRFVELYEADFPNDGLQLGNSISGGAGTFLLTATIWPTSFGPGSDRGFQLDLDFEDDSGVPVTFAAPNIGGTLIGFTNATSASGLWLFRVGTDLSGARMRGTWTGTTSLGESYGMEVHLTRMPQPAQTPVTII